VIRVGRPTSLLLEVIAMAFRPRFRRPRRGSAPLEDRRLAAWALGTVLHSGRYRQWETLCHVDDLLESLEVPEPPARVRKSPGLLRAYLERQLAALEPGSEVPPGTLRQNAARLAARLGLDAVATDCLAFGALSELSTGVTECFTSRVVGSRRRLLEIVAAALDRPAAAVVAALSGDAPLAATGLLRVELEDDRGRGPFRLPPGLVGALLDDVSDDAAFAAHFFRLAPAPRLGLADFEHLDAHLAVLLPYLRRALADRRPGVNVLVAGPPGTGKTQLCVALAVALAAPLHLVRTEDADGDPLPPDARLAHLRLTTRLLSGQDRALVLLDEVEDVLGALDDLRPFSREPPVRKASFLPVLETNPVPTLWITNRLAGVDPAVLRRFDYHLPMPVPPRSVRARVLEAHRDAVPLPPDRAAAIAACPAVTPADIDRAAAVAGTLRADGAAAVAAAFERTLASAVEVRGHRLGQVDPHEAEAFDLDVANASADLPALVDALRAEPRGRLCLQGPPGSGKTAFAYHLGRVAGLAVVARRASDLLDLYVGGTEKAIAATFREARPGRDLLLLDEADSLLRSRDGAQRSWEVSQVNELLVQLEAYAGLVVACTNRLPDLDAAALRRFDLLITFGPLTGAQRRRLVAEALGADDAPLSPDLGRRLDALPDLTAGDLAALRRQSRLGGRPRDAAALIAALEARKHARGGPVRRAGFVG
jgi:ATP-dependent 26S proteasome regulatory subunit